MDAAREGHAEAKEPKEMKMPVPVDAAREGHAEAKVVDEYHAHPTSGRSPRGPRWHIKTKNSEAAGRSRWFSVFEIIPSPPLRGVCW